MYEGSGPWPRDGGADAGDVDGGNLDAGSGTVTAQSTDAPVAIDGRLDEAAWRIDTQLLRPLEGASDNDARFAALWDSRYLYIGFRVLDAQLTADSSEAHQDDSVEVYLDPDLSRSRAYDAYDRQFIVGINRSELPTLTVVSQKCVVTLRDSTKRKLPSLKCSEQNERLV